MEKTVDTHKAAGVIIRDEDKFLQMDVFLVEKWEGEITPASEVEEILWIGSTVPEGIKLGSIFQHDVLPKLKEQALID